MSTRPLSHAAAAAGPAPAPADPQALQALIEALLPALRAAGEAVMAVYRSDFAVRGKADASPVTEADEQAEALLVRAIEGLGLGWPVVAEEACSRDGMPAAPGACFWLVDPLDGTKEFVARNGEFTLNVGLVVDGEPVLGLLLAPALGRLYAGARGLGAWMEEGGVASSRRAITCRRPPPAGLTVLDSRSHRDGEQGAAWLRTLPVAEVRTVGSSLKLALIAEGQADLYGRFGPTMEWDLAAGDAILRAAGGGVFTPDGALLRYGKPGCRNPAFTARGLNP
jgi:3'(2'), 5'-bisphosphate nucleotidase